MLHDLLKSGDTVERCGLILQDGYVVEVPNVSAEPETSYEMDPLSVVPIIGTAVATWHTHPDGPETYSGEDHKGFLSWPNLEHIVISPTAIRRYRVKHGAIIECD